MSYSGRYHRTTGAGWELRRRRKRGGFIQGGGVEAANSIQPGGGVWVYPLENRRGVQALHSIKLSSAAVFGEAEQQARGGRVGRAARL